MKNKIYEIIRKIVAKKATHNLGKVEIYDDEIVCYVDGKKIKKKEKYLHRYNLIFRNIPSVDKLYRIYRVDKPVHYIIEDVYFDREVNIMASMKNCHVTFKNCTFTACVEIDFADYITFINNKYKPQTYKNYCSIYKEGKFCISTRANKNEVNKIEFLCDSIAVEDTPIIPMVRATDIGKKQLSRKTKKTTLKMWLYAKEIILTTSDIIDAKSIEIGADKLNLYNVKINTEEIEIDAQNIESSYCEITSDVILMNTDYYIGKIKVNHCGMFMNGVEVNKFEKKDNVSDLELQNKRLELINTLKKIGTLCEEEISMELRKQPLTKVLKK